MFTNYLKIAFRNLVKNRLFSLINITGLALGMAAATLLLLNIQYGLSVDQFHTKKGAIYLAYTKGIINGNLDCGEGTAAPLGPALKSYPEVKSIARTMEDNRQLGYADKKIPAEGQVTDPAFLSMFTFLAFTRPTYGDSRKQSKLPCSSKTLLEESDVHPE